MTFTPDRMREAQKIPREEPSSTFQGNNDTETNSSLTENESTKTQVGMVREINQILSGIKAFWHLFF
jgi:hypothetical protein